MEPVVSLIDTPEALAPHLRAWDALAVAAGRPYCAPAWMLSWWRHAAPRKAALRVIVVTDGEDLVAVAPFYAERTAVGTVYRMLGSEIAARAEPLALPGREEEAAVAFAQTLAGATPRPAALSFHQIHPDSPWPELLRLRWPGRAPRVIRDETIPAPTIRLADRDFDDYMASLATKLRGKLRRDRRHLEGQGASYRLLDDPEDLRRGLAEFARLHYGRWDPRGGSGALNPDVERMLADVAGELLGEGRFRLCTIDLGEKTISAQLFVTAGGEVSYWLGGFDPEWANRGPGNQALLPAIEDAIERGEQRLDLGPGAQEYKRRLADGEDLLESLTLVTRSSRYPLVRGRRMALAAREALSERLPDRLKHPLRRP